MSITNKGTPRSLLEAIDNGIEAGGPNGELGHDTKIVAHVRDFLAQRFGAAMLAVDTAEAERLQTLFKNIVD